VALIASWEWSTSIVMKGFAERVRHELVERPHRRPVELRDDLTPQERQIAALVDASAGCDRTDDRPGVLTPFFTGGCGRRVGCRSVGIGIVLQDPSLRAAPCR
jgi:hypothetical protein